MFIPIIGIVYVWEKPSSTLFSKLGPVGDYLGGTTISFLTLSSIIFVVAAIIMQKEELSLQRTEISNSNKEFRESNDNLKKQSFENLFFNTLQLLERRLNDITYRQPKGNLSGLNAIVKINKIYKSDIIYSNFTEKYNHISESILSNPTIMESLIVEKVNHDMTEKRIISEIQTCTEISKLNILLSELNSQSAISEIQSLDKAFWGDFNFIENNLVKKMTCNLFDNLNDTVYKYLKTLKVIISLVESNGNTNENEIYWDILKAQISYEEYKLLYWFVFYIESDSEISKILKDIEIY